MKPKSLKPKSITPLTSFVAENEKCYCLVEINSTPLAMGIEPETNKGYRGLRRYRLIWVNRDGRLALFRDESPNSIGAPPVRIPGLFEHSVGELIGIADQHAHIGSAWEKELALEKRATSTLHKDIGDQIERDALMKQNRSSFGRYSRVERNGYPSKAIPSKRS